MLLIIEDSARRVRIMLYLPGPNTYEARLLNLKVYNKELRQ